MKKIIRSICLFSLRADFHCIDRLKELQHRLIQHGFEVQTLRLVTAADSITELSRMPQEAGLFYSPGTLSRQSLFGQTEEFLMADSVTCNLEIHDHVTEEDVAFLFDLIRRNAGKTFQFSYTFSNPPSTPFFPAAHYEWEGFAIGLQSTDLAGDCEGPECWFERQIAVWNEILHLFHDYPDFLGIDSSVAPLFTGNSSFIYHAARIRGSFSDACTSDFFVQISKFIKEHNPKPVGLCGLMFPCLEDFVLAEAYEKGEFNIERNIYLSLHSGTGIDTYPIGIDEDPKRIRQILNLLLAFSKKYKKPLSARFISDGKARIGDRTDFRNQYLKDVVIRKA